MKMNISGTRNETTNKSGIELNEFVIETILINPITKIIEGLKSGSFRDCDVKWLDAKLEKFILFAAQTLGITEPGPLNKDLFNVLNEYNREYYLVKFNTLLTYFKSL